MERNFEEWNKREAVARLFASCTSLFELTKCGERLANRLNQKAAWHSKEDLEYLRKVYGIMEKKLQLAYDCSPHNHKENHQIRDGKVWCKKCGRYIGRPIPQWILEQEEKKRERKLRQYEQGGLIPSEGGMAGGEPKEATLQWYD